MGFLTNQEESIKLVNDVFHEYIAKGIANGVLDYFDQTVSQSFFVEKLKGFSFDEA